jgi:hypothetical protein
MLASACVSRPWTPSVSVAYGAQTPDVRDLTLPARDDALRRWQLPPSDPWAGYAKYTLLTALDASPQRVELPDVTSLDDVQRAVVAARQVAAEGLPSDTMWIVDLRGAASVAFGATLSQAAREQVSLVPTFNNWPAEDELVPAEETLSALATMAPRLPDEAAGPSRPVFLLDAWRLAYRFDDPGDDTYDNRYILSASDLPDVETLRAHGIRRVLYVVASLDDTAVEEDDLHVLFDEYQGAGLWLAMVDLDVLQRPIGEQWGQVWVNDCLVVRPRVTIIDEPSFYLRARGGFGGVHARPSPVHAGGGWTGPGGYGGFHGGGG